MVQLSGDPVTVQSANAATPFSKSQRQAKKDQLRAAQAPAVAAVQAKGGQVLGSFQSSYNGLKVRIAANSVAGLLNIPGVIGVHKIQTYTPDNIHGVPLIGAPAAWDGLAGFHGEGVKIAVIDTGIDYTHADFGGPGTAQAYTDAHAAETLPADPSMFGPGAPKVKGGIDLVGDTYNADPASPDYQPVPHPDSNPLDCFGHGTHVAGTAAGFGVLDDGTTYGGPYNATTISGHGWNVGPGVAPKADLYAVRVFGCEGSTDVTVEAIEWAVDNDMDVINMSLGSSFGGGDDPSAVAASNAAKAGVIVVASSGNSGFVGPYLTGSPASGDGVISVAAIDPTATFAGTTLVTTTGKTIPVAAANDVALADGTLDVVVLRNPDGSVSLGCDPNEYLNANVAGKLVVTARGTCARVARAVYGQKAGAAAVLMINQSSESGYPPFEGHITQNPDTGENYTVTIPFVGALFSSTANLNAAPTYSETSTAGQVANPAFRRAAGFSSGGPRVGDSWLKPDVAAPGVSIASAGIGTGNQLAFNSGTSMAAPHTAGLAALVRQAHPTWKKVEDLKAAIVNTADPDLTAGYRTSVLGAGLIQAVGATTTQVVAVGDPGTATLNFGVSELKNDFSKGKTIKVRNYGSTSASFTVGVTKSAGLPHSVTVSPSSVTIPAGGTVNVTVTLNVPSATADRADNTFRDVAGLIEFTPTGGSNGGVKLRVPYYHVPLLMTNTHTKLDTKTLVRNGHADATVTNNGSAAGAGIADWYSWGLSDGVTAGMGGADVRAIGVQTFPDDGVLVFAVSVDKAWSSAATQEFDIYVDVDSDGVDDYVVFAADQGAVQTGTFNGRVATFVFNLKTGTTSLIFLATAPANGSTIEMPVAFSQLTGGTKSLASDHPRFSYHAVGFDLNSGAADVVDGTAKFNAFSPSVSTGGFTIVAPGATVAEPISYNAAEFSQTPALGFLIISQDNGASTEAQTISIG